MSKTQSSEEQLSRLIIEFRNQDGYIEPSEQRDMKDEIMQLIAKERLQAALEVLRDLELWGETHSPNADLLQGVKHFIKSIEQAKEKYERTGDE